MKVKEDIIDYESTGPKRKKTKRDWCGKKEGRKHKLVYRVYKKWGNEKASEVACEKCGKNFEVDYAWYGQTKKGKQKSLDEWNKKLNLQ